MRRENLMHEAESSQQNLRGGTHIEWDVAKLAINSAFKDQMISAYNEEKVQIEHRLQQECRERCEAVRERLQKEFREARDAAEARIKKEFRKKDLAARLNTDSKIKKAREVNKEKLSEFLKRVSGGCEYVTYPTARNLLRTFSNGSLCEAENISWDMMDQWFNSLTMHYPKEQRFREALDYYFKEYKVTRRRRLVTGADYRDIFYRRSRARRS